MASIYANTPNYPYKFNHKKFQKRVFLLVWPLFNLLLISAVQIDLGRFAPRAIILVAINLWLTFGLSFLVLQWLEKQFSNKVFINGFLAKFFLYIITIIGIRFLLTYIFGNSVSLGLSQTLTSPRVVLILEVLTYLAFFHLLVQKEYSLATELALRETELNRLRSQSNPHFLFNTLNLINAEISNDPDNAKEIVFDLADLLRRNIKNAQQSFTTVEEEFALTNLYLSLQQKRFKDRLSFSIELMPETKELIIPSLLLQPAIENTVKHAVAPFASKAHIKLTASLLDNQLAIVIKDTGKPFDHTQLKEGNGFRILRKTLALCYQDNYQLQLTSSSSGGVFTLNLPAQYSI